MQIKLQKHSVVIFVLLFFLFPLLSTAKEPSVEQLKTYFQTPPFEARPKTWLHSMSSNMSKEGFTKDLEAIAKAGMSGVLLFNVTHTIPKGKILFDSKEHHDILKHAAKESERLGLTFGIHNSDGWTSSGGPWITPEHSMKMLNWSEIYSKGGKIETVLPQPTARENYYKDVAVIAFPASDTEILDLLPPARYFSSQEELDFTLLTDQRWDEEIILLSSESNNGFITVEFEKPRSINSLFVSLHKTISGSRKYRIYASNDGKEFDLIAEDSLLRLGKREFAINYPIDNVTAKYFKLETEDTYRISELKFSSRANYDSLLARTSLFMRDDHRIKPLVAPAHTKTVARKDIIDLTHLMDEKGHLSATLAKGDWIISRFAYTSTSAVNSPASDEGRGLEADKMNKNSVALHYNSYPKKVHNNVRDVAPNSLQYVEIDSFEVGGQNWTHGYDKLFANAHSYRLLRFLPLYTGRIVDDIETSSAVLGDIRRFNSKLITENYFKHFNELADAEKLTSYFEPYSFNAPFNEIDAGRYADIPMGEFWVRGKYQAGTAVSSAHLYGKKIVSAEAFTASPKFNWKTHPGSLKHVGDNAWVRGINEFMFHRYAHQANTHVKPGMTMSYFGSHIDRTQTWWNDAAPAWFTYIARGSYLLRQGNPVSDLLVFMGDGAPNSVTRRNQFRPHIPPYINFINSNKDALINRISPKNGMLVLPEGTRFRALALFNSEEMSIEVARKLDKLANENIVIIGKQPKRLTGFGHKKTVQDEFDGLIKNIWSKPTTYSHNKWDEIFKERHFIADMRLQQSDDYLYAHRETSDAHIYFLVNTGKEARSYIADFLVTEGMPQKWNPVTGDVSHLANYKHKGVVTSVPIYLNEKDSIFIIFKKKPKLSRFNHIVQAQVYLKDKPVEYGELLPKVNPSTQAIEVELPRHTSVDFTFADGTQRTFKANTLPKKIGLNTWNITFNKEYGYDKTLTSKSLFDWSKAKEFDLKHYSGTAKYKTRFSLPQNIVMQHSRWILDLGKVFVSAHVRINGQDVQTLWGYPYKVDVSDFLKSGENTLEISVSNLWVNRLIGDQHYEANNGYLEKNQKLPKFMPKWYTDNSPPPPSSRITFTTYDFYTKDDPLLTSGLVGPVELRPISRVIIK